MIPYGWHWEFGWLRRVELDCNNPRRFAYELPDGSIAFSSAPEHREQAYLVVEKSLSLGRVVKFACDKAVQ